VVGKAKYILLISSMLLLLSSVNVFAQSDNDSESVSAVDSSFTVDDNYSGDDLDAAEIQVHTEEAMRAAKPVQYRSVDKEKWQRDIRKSGYKYTVQPPAEAVDERPQLEINRAEGVKLSSRSVKAIVVTLAACVALVILYLLLGDRLLARRRTEPKVEAQQDWEAVETFTEWDRAIADAEATGDYRLAIRIMYLHCLKLLHERNVITFNKETSNATYLAAISTTNYAVRFRSILRTFNYTWYGNYAISREGYLAAKKDIQQFQHSIA
jgi:hypothetical protein